MSAAVIQLTAARLTPAGRGAVATIRVCADAKTPSAGIPVADVVQDHDAISREFAALNPLFCAANGRPLNEQPLKKIAFGKWGETNGEDLVVCRESLDVLEIHCHGGEAAVQRILGDLSNVGCAVIDWRQQTELMSDILDSECADVLSRTSTWRTTKIVLEQSNGLLRSAFLRLSESSRVADALTRELDPEIDDTTHHLAADTAWKQQVTDLLRWADFGLHLSKPWSVVLTGRPNVGKSSLINALLGYQRAIVFDEPGTTRDVVTGETAFDGWPVMLADTAGIRDNVEGLEAAGIALARERLETADLCLVLLDIGESPTSDDFELLRAWPEALVVGHKSDRPNCWGDHLPGNAILVSSTTNDGLIELQQELVRRLIPQVPVAGTPIPLTSRQVELLRQLNS